MSSKEDIEWKPWVRIGNQLKWTLMKDFPFY